jgi:hypothetical protein
MEGNHLRRDLIVKSPEPGEQKTMNLAIYLLEVFRIQNTHGQKSTPSHCIIAKMPRLQNKEKILKAS